MTIIAASPLVRANNFMQRHQLASSLIAGSLLASVASVSAAAISYNGQLAMEAYSPTVSQIVSIETAAAEVASASTTVEPSETSEASQSTQTATIQTATATVLPANTTLTASTGSRLNQSAPSSPVTVTPPNGPVSENPPIGETSDESETAPGFTISFEYLDQLSMRGGSQDPNPTHVNTALIHLTYDDGYTPDGKQYAMTAAALSNGYDCTFYTEKPGKMLMVEIPEATADGDYSCRLTVSDGTITRSADYTVRHEALPPEDPQPASGYEFTFNMPLLGTIDGLNVYTSKFNYGAMPFCGASIYYPCTTTASVYAEIRLADGITVAEAHETIANPDYPGLTCEVHVRASHGSYASMVAVLTARTDSNLENGIYFCEFNAVDGQPDGRGVLMAELWNGQFRSITADELGELPAEL